VVLLSAGNAVMVDDPPLMVMVGVRPAGCGVPEAGP